MLGQRTVIKEGNTVQQSLIKWKGSPVENRTKIWRVYYRKRSNIIKGAELARERGRDLFLLMVCIVHTTKQN
ncbi:hypothetical protein CR513_03134, partial [Mucuna pruriens]